MHYIDFSDRMVLSILIAVVGMTSIGSVLLLVWKKILAPMQLIKQYNVQQINECTSDNCAVMLIPEKQMQTGEIGDLMKSRNMMLRHLENILRERQENYEKIKKLEQMKEDLSRMIIHDLKNPLSVTLMTMELLQRKNNLPKDYQRLVHQALKGGQDMKRMIQNLLDISRIEEGKLELHRFPLAVDQFLVEVVTDIRESNMLEERTLHFTNRAPELQIIVDPDLLHRVFINIISNAIKHTASNGFIEIRTNLNINQNQVEISVSDNGNGIPKEYHQKIFEKFEQVNIKDQKSGSGLGLAFCKLAIETHGGRIWVESEQDKGSRFFLELPLTITNHGELQKEKKKEYVA
ncbi:MAG: HAMP domain-containing histidine kinase [Ignavibacteriae bacterium]|nr:HAMP domain-containing histidine kinase [Ignavibacteriota bacterium]